MLGELDKLQVNNVLISQVMGRLACTDGIHPYIVPVTYAYDGEYIYGQTNKGKKLDMLRRTPMYALKYWYYPTWPTGVPYSYSANLKNLKKMPLKKRGIYYSGGYFL